MGCATSRRSPATRPASRCGHERADLPRRPAAVARAACSSSITGAAPTSTTCSALGDVLDPERRLHVVTPRAPLQLPGWPGYHWYVVPRVGYPDPETFHAAYGALAAFHDELWERTGVTPERTVLGGFSMGSVMSYCSASAPTARAGGDPRLLRLRPRGRGLGARLVGREHVGRSSPRPPGPGHGGRLRAQGARPAPRAGSTSATTSPTRRTTSTRRTSRPRGDWLAATLR